MLTKVQNGGWETIAKDIAYVSDANNRGEFEEAKQAFLHITLPANRNRAAAEIAAKWAEDPTNKGKNIKGEAIDPDIAVEAELATLKALKPYPLMNDTDVLEASVRLVKKPNIKTFLANEKIKVDASGAIAELKDKGIIIAND